MSVPQIIAIMLIKNEDLFIEQGIRNILDFCDKIIVADHHSTDGTSAIVRKLAAQYPKIDYRVIDHPSETHGFISGYAGGPNWVFGVDGDEVYDAERLRSFRPELLAGKHNAHFKVMGNVLNIQDLDREQHVGRGHLAPPCRSMTKLYNFGAIDAWPPPTPERLHGGQITFRPGYSDMSTWPLFRERPWEDSPFRCLHLCFTSRSTLDKPGKDGKVRIRKGVGEGMLWARNLRAWVMGLFGHELAPYYKRELYGRGPLVEKDISPFGL